MFLDLRWGILQLYFAVVVAIVSTIIEIVDGNVAERNTESLADFLVAKWFDGIMYIQQLQTGNNVG